MVQAAALGLAAPARALLAWQQTQRPPTLNRGFNQTSGFISVPRFVGFWVSATLCLHWLGARLMKCRFR